MNRWHSLSHAASFFDRPCAPPDLDAKSYKTNAASIHHSMELTLSGGIWKKGLCGTSDELVEPMPSAASPPALSTIPAWNLAV